MGSCYSIPYFLESNKKEEKCILCWETINSQKLYIKCTYCFIYLHENCVINMKNICCPNCKVTNSLIKYQC